MATTDEAFGSSGPVKATEKSNPSPVPQRVIHHLKHLFDAPTCPVTSVIVYTDKAEVSRFLRCSIRQGENEIVIGRLSHAIDKDSIRVELHGRGCIQEVLYRAIPVQPEEDENHQHFVELTRELADARRQKDSLTAKQHRAQKQRSVLDSFADNLMKAESGRDKNGELTSVSNVMDANLLQGMSNFFDMYEKHAEKLDSQLMELTTELKDLDLQMENLEEAVRSIENVKEEKRKRYLSILIDAYDDGEVEIHFSYVVSKVKWMPKYDIRVFSRDNALKLMYFGSIQNNTGEDWVEAKLSLSTAMPSNAVVAPSDLGIQKLFFKPTKYYTYLACSVPPNSSRHLPHPSVSSLASRGSAPPPTPFGLPQLRRSGKALKAAKDLQRPLTVIDPMQCSLIASESTHYSPKPLQHHNPHYGEACPDGTRDGTSSESSEPAMGGFAGAAIPHHEFLKCQARDQIPCATFEISRKNTILANNEGHKVAIGIIDFNPIFEYESIPKKAPHAYLKARLRNLSTMALLPGPANVYIDNNYISKTEIRLVSPQEEFYCLLGSDPGVEVKYNPAHKIRETSNISGKVITTTYKQVTEVRNSYSEPIKILIIDQLPISSEEKIKVTLQEPVIKHPEKKRTKINQ